MGKCLSLQNPNNSQATSLPLAQQNQQLMKKNKQIEQELIIQKHQNMGNIEIGDIHVIQRKQRNYSYSRNQILKQTMIQDQNLITLHPFFNLDYSNWDYKYKSILVKFQIPATQNIELDQLKPKISQWARNLFYTLAQQAFYGFYSNKMTETETKYFFSNNIIINQVRVLKFLKKNQQKLWQKQGINILTYIDQESREAIKFLKKQFPQKQHFYVRPELKQLIHEKDSMNTIQNQILVRMKNNFNDIKLDAESYTQLKIIKKIKLIINEIIDLTQKNFPVFQSKISQIFKNLNSVEYKIGTKLLATPKYTDIQINQKRLVIKTPQMMRIIIKWIDELEQKIKNPEKYIKDREDSFNNVNMMVQDKLNQIKLNKQKQIKFNELQKYYLTNKLKEFVKKNKTLENFDEFMIKINSTLSYLPSYLEKYTKYFTSIKQNQIENGLSTYVLYYLISDIITNYLTTLLFNIIKFQKQIASEQKNITFDYTGSYIKSNVKNFSKASYITFSVSDLLRGKCQGTPQEIRLIYEKLQQNFKIVRVKNRLASGNRDFLINMILVGQKNSPPMLCEFQLGLKSDKQEYKKMEYLDHFNHYIYELERSKFGPLAEVVILNNSLNSSTLDYFKQKMIQLNQKFRIQQNTKLIVDKTDRGYKQCFNINKQMILDIFNNKMDFKKIIEVGNKKYQFIIDIETFICYNCYHINIPYDQFFYHYKEIENSDQTFKSNKIICSYCIFNTYCSFGTKNKLEYLLKDKVNYFKQISINKMQQSSIGYFGIIRKGMNLQLQMYLKIYDKYVKTFTNSNDIHLYTEKDLRINYVFELKNQSTANITVNQSRLDYTFFTEKNNQSKVFTQIYILNQQDYQKFITTFQISKQNLIQLRKYKLQKNSQKQLKLQIITLIQQTYKEARSIINIQKLKLLLSKIQSNCDRQRLNLYEKLLYKNSQNYKSSESLDYWVNPIQSQSTQNQRKQLRKIILRDIYVNDNNANYNKFKFDKNNLGEKIIGIRKFKKNSQEEKFLQSKQRKNIIKLKILATRAQIYTHLDDQIEFFQKQAVIEPQIDIFFEIQNPLVYCFTKKRFEQIIQKYKEINKNIEVKPLFQKPNKDYLEFYKENKEIEFIYLIKKKDNFIQAEIIDISPKIYYKTKIFEQAKKYFIKLRRQLKQLSKLKNNEIQNDQLSLTLQLRNKLVITSGFLNQQMNGNPKDAEYWKNLKHISFFRNRISNTQFLEKLNLENLRILNLSHNQLKKFDSTKFKLRLLDSIKLSNNQLTFFNLVDLPVTKINIRQNRFQSQQNVYIDPQIVKKLQFCILIAGADLEVLKDDDIRKKLANKLKVYNKSISFDKQL